MVMKDFERPVYEFWQIGKRYKVYTIKDNYIGLLKGFTATQLLLESITDHPDFIVYQSQIISVSTTLD